MTNAHPNGSGVSDFEAEFVDLPHYIRVITARIWEACCIGDINRYHSDPCIVETPLVVSTCLTDVIVSSRPTLKTFPDRRFLAEDVFVSGDDQNGYLNSYAIIPPLTRLSDCAFGLATGKKIHARSIAGCRIATIPVMWSGVVTTGLFSRLLAYKDFFVHLYAHPRRNSDHACGLC